jgi:hypothetical protein
MVARSHHSCTRLDVVNVMHLDLLHVSSVQRSDVDLFSTTYVKYM